MTPPISESPAANNGGRFEIDENGVVSENNPSKDQDARWVKKDGKFKLDYKQHTRTDHEGYIEKLHISAGNEHECNHFEPLLQDSPKEARFMPTKAETFAKYPSLANFFVMRAARKLAYLHDTSLSALLLL